MCIVNNSGAKTQGASLLVTEFEFSIQKRQTQKALKRNRQRWFPLTWLWELLKREP
jgi:hypothetical protein